MNIKYYKMLLLDDDEYYQQEYQRFDEYLDIANIDSLRDLIVSFHENTLLKEFDETAKYIVNQNLNDSLKLKSNPFINLAIKQLRVPIVPINIPHIHPILDFKCIEALIMLLECNCFYYSNKNSNLEEIVNQILNGNILSKLSLLVEEYKSNPLTEYNETFFEKIKNIKFNDKRAEKLEDFLRGGYLNRIYICEQEASVIGYNYIKLTTRYLMACSAIKNNHMGITCEDVVIGYILTLKIFKEDLRPEIRKAHTEYSYK